MSLNLYFASIFGKIESTDIIEAENEALIKDYKLYNEFANSPDLQLYIELDQLIHSDSFIQQKKEIQQLAFKGSTEFNLLKEFSRLKKNNRIRKFFVTDQSDELKRFHKIKSSTELKRYQELKAFIESAAFLEEKSKLKAETFKGSGEEKLLKEFNQLRKNRKLNGYFKFIEAGEPNAGLAFEKSKEWKQYQQLNQKNKSELTKDEKTELKALKHQVELKKYLSFLKSGAYTNYLAIHNGAIPARYKELEKQTTSKDFLERKAYLCDRQKFEKTESFARFLEYMKLKDSDDLKFYFNFIKSSAYKNYLLIKDAPELKRYLELETLTTSQEFLEKKAYLEDTKRWEKTDEFKKEQKCEELRKLSGVINYLKYKDSDAFDFIENWTPVFEDDFIVQPSREKWINKSYQALKAVGDNFSQQGDLQAFTEGKNISIKDSILGIEVKQEKTGGLVWKPAFGFFEEEFEYSSGIITTAETGWWKYGIFEAKVKYDPDKSLLDAIYLLGEERTPQISLLEQGIVKQVGVKSLDTEGLQESVKKFSGLKKGAYYIFRLEWSADKLCWKINNYEVFSTTNDIPSVKMHLNLASIVVKKPTSLPHSFNIDWIRIYQPKK